MDTEYQTWLADPTPDNLNKVVEAANPIITSEIHRYNGPKTLLRSEAKLLAAKAVKTYDPSKGTALRTWVVSQLQPLTRYSNTLKPMKISEDMSRKSAELNNVTQQLAHELGRAPSDAELADHMGISTVKIGKLREQAKPVMTESAFQPESESEEVYEPATSEVSNLGFASEAVYDNLDERSKVIYDFKTGAHGKKMLSNQEIAQRLGVTPSMITQITNDVSKRIIQANQNAI